MTPQVGQFLGEREVLSCLGGPRNLVRVRCTCGDVSTLSLYVVKRTTLCASCAMKRPRNRRRQVYDHSEIMRLRADGRSIRWIAARLGCQRSTVEAVVRKHRGAP